MKDYKDGCVRYLTILIVLIALLFIWPFIIVWLWNSVVTGLFPNVGELTYWRAMGLYVLCNILFKTTTSVGKE